MMTICLGEHHADSVFRPQDDHRASFDHLARSQLKIVRSAQIAQNHEDPISRSNALVVIHWPTPGLARIKLFKCDSEGADPPRFSPEPTCHVFGSNLVANCAEYYGSAGSSGY